MATLSRVRGPEAHPFYRWAATRAGGEPRWNFHKYLVSRDGRQVQGFPARVDPDSPALKRALELALAAGAPAG
jgi:glutathione peroxidase